MRKMKYLMILLLCQQAWANHPTGNDMDMQHGAAHGSNHGTKEVPSDTAVPAIQATLVEDPMDGFNLVLTLAHFNLVPPVEGADDSVTGEDGEKALQGHLHLYINGKKVMRLYGPAVHLPKKLLKDGMNSLTISANNHRHATYTWHDKDIQSTLLVDTRSDGLVVNRFTWPDK